MLKTLFKRPIRWALFSLGIFLAIGLGLVVLSGLADFDLSIRSGQEVTFEHAGSQISGSLHVPDGSANPPLVILVHGDGPQDRYAGGAYLPLISFLLDQGIAVFSWDKPGVGKSTGNWLAQSMDDRAQLALKAPETLRKVDEFSNAIIGFVGFSQAGWVVPQISIQEDIADFHVLVGPAVDWIIQGRYFTRTRLKLEGFDKNRIDIELAEFEREVALLQDPELTHEAYIDAFPSTADMTRERFDFIRKNITSNSTAALSRTQAPFLILHGAEDLNVDARDENRRFKELLGQRHPATEIHLIDNATHALLDARFFNHQTPDTAPVWTGWMFMSLGREAYAQDALERLANWIKARAAKTQ